VAENEAEGMNLTDVLLLVVFVWQWIGERYL